MTGPGARQALRLAGMRPLPRLLRRSPLDLHGKRILLTGASSGIGATAAGKLAAYGATVLAVARRGDLLTEVVASKAALSAVSRVIDNELADAGVCSTTIYYPLVATPMIAPTRAYDGLAALSADEAAGWMVDAARLRPVRIAPRKTLPLRALDIVSPRLLNGVMKRSTPQPNRTVGGRVAR